MANCYNNEGSFTCQCRDSYTGDGILNCNPLGECNNVFISFIIHRVKTKKTTTVKEVGYSILTSRFWRFFFSAYSIIFVSIEDIYQRLETVFHGLSKHFEFRQKYSATFSTLFSVLDIPMKYCLSYLMYFKYSERYLYKPIGNSIPFTIVLSQLKIVVIFVSVLPLNACRGVFYT